MRYFLRGLILFTSIGCAWVTAAAGLDLVRPNWEQTWLAQNERGSAGRISMAEATEIVRRNTGGRVLDAQPSTRDGRDGYRIKVLVGSGEVRVFFVEARGGSMRQE